MSYKNIIDHFKTAGTALTAAGSAAVQVLPDSKSAFIVAAAGIVVTGATALLGQKVSNRLCQGVHPC